MDGWAQRQVGQRRARRATWLVLGAPRQDPSAASVAASLTGEPLIPRRGGWSARQAAATVPDTDGHDDQNADQPNAAGGGRVRWNLSA
jgi:hypothetical protein